MYMYQLLQKYYIAISLCSIPGRSIFFVISNSCGNDNSALILVLLRASQMVMQSFESFYLSKTRTCHVVEGRVHSMPAKMMKNSVHNDVDHFEQSTDHEQLLFAHSSFELQVRKSDG